MLWQAVSIRKIRHIRSGKGVKEIGAGTAYPWCVGTCHRLLMNGFVSLIRMSEEGYHMEVDRLMGVKCSSNTRNSNSSKYEENQVPPGMTPIVCQRCGRKLGQAYSTNSVATCDKCGCQFYIRIYGGVKVTMPAVNLQYEGYYEETDSYIHKIRTVVNGDQKLIRNPISEVM